MSMTPTAETIKTDKPYLTISLIIPAHNEEKYIWACLEHILRYADGHIHEVIVIDNASTDTTKQIAEQYPGVRVITEHTKWLTFARQRWYKEATGDVLAFVDADTHMPKWWAKLLKHHFESSENIWFVSGPYHYYDLPWYKQIGNRLYRRILGYPTYLLTWYLWVGGNFAIKKSVLDMIDGFDTKIVFYGEDTDIARRAAKCSTTKFTLRLVMPTSARRFVGEWMFKTGYIYITNFLSQAIFHRSATKDYKDFR